MNNHLRPHVALMSGLLGLSAVILASLSWAGQAQAQTLRCTDANGNVSYVGAGAQTAQGCAPLNVQTAARDLRGESHGAATGQSQAASRGTDSKETCMTTIAGSLFAPTTARFSLSPSGPSALIGYVDAQNRVGAFQRREVWCEFSAGGALQHAYVDQDPSILRENLSSN
jgi:hypothetical protein